MKILIVISTLLFACGKGNDEPARPADGSPMVFEVTEVKPGKRFDGKVEVRAYNFAEQPIAGYHVALRFRDASDKPLEVDGDAEGSASFVGKGFISEPKSWCTFTIKSTVPDGAAKADVVASRLTAVKEDRLHMEEKPLFERAN